MGYPVSAKPGRGEQEPAYELRRAAEAGWLELVVYMPLLASARDIDAEVLNGNNFKLQVPGRYFLLLELPSTVSLLQLLALEIYESIEYLAAWDASNICVFWTELSSL